MKHTSAGSFFHGSVQWQNAFSDFYVVLGGVPLEYEQPTVPSAVPEDPAVTSSVSTPTQQNLQPDVTSTCKFGLS